jgi:transposase
MEMRPPPEPLELSAAELAELKARYKQERDRRKAERIHCVILFAEGYRLEEISRILMRSVKALYGWLAVFRQLGVKGLCRWEYQGRQSELNEEQWAEVEQELARKVYRRAKEVAAYVKAQFQIEYSERGMQALLRRKGYRRIKSRLVPGKAKAAQQEAWVIDYEKLKATLQTLDRIYFVDAVHPTHNVQITYVWTKKGQRRRIRSNTGRERYNILGAYCPRDREYIDVRGTENVNGQTLTQLIDRIRERHPEAGRILLILDNARYNHAHLVQEYVANTPVELHYLPSYSPNLNLIERLWGFLKDKALGDYHPTFEGFVDAIAQVLDHLQDYEEELATLMTEKFEILACD